VIVVGELDVELIPWRHHVAQQMHADVLAYLKELPRNSSIGLEITPEALERANANTEAIKPGLLQPPSFFAMMELLAVCKSRNIRVVPLETQTLFKSHGRVQKKHSAYFSTVQDKLDVAKEQELINAEKARERGSVRRIREVLPKIKRKPFVVIIGAFHTQPIQEQLRSVGISSNVNTRFTTDKAILKKMMDKNKKFRAAIESGDAADALKHMQANEVSKGMIRSRSGMPTALTQHIEKRQTSITERRTARGKKRIKLR
jgi:hypothetical protein